VSSGEEIFFGTLFGHQDTPNARGVRASQVVKLSPGITLQFMQSHLFYLISFKETGLTISHLTFVQGKIRHSCLRKQMLAVLK